MAIILLHTKFIFKDFLDDLTYPWHMPLQYIYNNDNCNLASQFATYIPAAKTAREK